MSEMAMVHDNDTAVRESYSWLLQKTENAI